MRTGASRVNVSLRFSLCDTLSTSPTPPPPPPLCRWSIVRFIDTFDHSGHTCIVFEYLSYSLYELLRRTHFKGSACNYAP